MRTFYQFAAKNTVCSRTLYKLKSKQFSRDNCLSLKHTSPKRKLETEILFWLHLSYLIIPSCFVRAVWYLLKQKEKLYRWRAVQNCVRNIRYLYSAVILIGDVWICEWTHWVIVLCIKNIHIIIFYFLKQYPRLEKYCLTG